MTQRKPLLLDDGTGHQGYDELDADDIPALPYDASGAAAAVTTTSIGAVPTARTVSAGTGLTGGGDLSANRTLASDFGTGAGKVTQGNDSRLTDARTPTGAAGGDLGGTYPNPSVTDDSHSHTAATLPAAGADLSGVDFLVGTASGLLSAEIPVGTSPGGELGGTWASPTVDATHSGSAHHDPVTVGTGLDVTGQLVELDLSEVSAGGELGGTMDAPTVDATHSGSTHAATQAAAEATASGALTTHAGAADPHTGYRLESADHTHASTGLQGGTIAYSALTGTPAAERAAASTTPAAIGTGAVGVGTTDARADHVHATGAGTPSTQAIGDAAATGSGPAAAMTDHKHAITNPLTTAGDLWVGGASGAPTRLAKGSDSQVLTVDPTTHLLVWATPSSGGAVATDVIWDAKGDLAAGTGANTAAALTVGANDTILMADSAQSTGLKWVASQTPSTQAFGDAAAEGTADTYARGDHKHAMPAAPLAQSFIGYNTVGGTFVASGGNRQYMKKVTLATAAIVQSIDVYLRSNADSVGSAGCGLLSDASGVPDLLIASNSSASILLSNSTSGFPDPARWLSIPLGVYVAAGDYWLMVFTGGVQWDLAYDSGSDVTQTNTGGYLAGAHASIARTTTSNKYSIRASILS